LKDGQVLDLPKGSKPKRVLSVSTLPGIVVDDSSAEFDGAWTVSHGASQFFGKEYRHDGNDGKGELLATFSANLKTAGRYEVRFSFPSNRNRASNVPVTVHHQNKETAVTVNQKLDAGDNEGFVSLGTFSFAMGPTKVVVSNQGTNGYVVIDAVQWFKSK
jgi:hypothetical protein